MDFSILEPLFKLREEVHEHLTDPAALAGKATAELLQRVALHREHALAALAKAKARKPMIHDILRAAAARLPALDTLQPREAPGPAVKSKRSKPRKKPK